MAKVIHFKNVRNQDLTGDFYPVDSDKIVLLAHGYKSDRKSTGKFPRFAQAYNEASFDAMAFDFADLEPAHQVEDLAAAIQWAKEQGYKKIVLHGHSLGGYDALANYSPAITTMILTGPVTDPGRWNKSPDQKTFLGAVKCPVLIIHGTGEDRELSLLEATRKGFEYLPKGSKLEIVEGADHGFYDYVDEYIGLAQNWLKRFI